jgi:hypothetical protein
VWALGDMGYRLQQHPCASAEEVGQWAFKHLGLKQSDCVWAMGDMGYRL